MGATLGKSGYAAHLCPLRFLLARIEMGGYTARVVVPQESKQCRVYPFRRTSGGSSGEGEAT